jgi:hypothetical protein
MVSGLYPYLMPSLSNQQGSYRGECMSEPRYLFGDEYAYNGGYEELINCDTCAVEFDRAEYKSDTCVNCENERVKREMANK